MRGTTRAGRGLVLLAFGLGAWACAGGGGADVPPDVLPDVAEAAPADLPGPGDADPSPEASLDLTPDQPAEVSPDLAPEQPAEVSPDLPAPGDAEGAPDLPEPAEEVTPDLAPDLGPPTPPALYLTVDALPAGMNGSEPYRDNSGVLTAFRLHLPPAGFTVDVTVTPGDAPVAPEGLHLSASVAAGGEPPGSGLGGWFAWTDDTHATWRVPPQKALGEAPQVVLEAWVEDQAGLASAPVSLTVGVRALTPALDPFVEPDLWLLDTRRDLDSVEVHALAGAYEVVATNTPNGQPDFAETLAAFGFLGPDEAFNQAFEARYREAVRANLHTMFDLGPGGEIGDDSVRIRFVFDGEEGAPDPAAYSDQGSFSMIAIGGDSFDAFGNPTGYFGRAWIDANNQEQDDNTVPGNGVFFTALMRKVASFAALKPLLAPIVPPEGVPLGGREGDEALLDPSYNPNSDPDSVRKQRGVVFRFFLQVGGIGLAALTAHEIGHSLGLVAPGPPPTGLFGGASQADFVVGPADGWHIDTAGPNLMQSGSSLNIADFLTTYPRYNPLNLAYLKRRLVVDPDWSEPLPAPLAPRTPRAPRRAIP